MKIFIAGFSLRTHQSDLEELFSKFGTVLFAEVVYDFQTDESRGFGFVDMENDDDAEKAIETLDGRCWHGRRLKVAKAQNQ